TSSICAARVAPTIRCTVGARPTRFRSFPKERSVSCILVLQDNRETAFVSPPGKHMPFVRILLLIVAVLALGVVGLAVFRLDPEAPAPQAESARPPVARPIPAPPRERREILSPADASSSAEITAREAAEAERRLEPEQDKP